MIDISEEDNNEKLEDKINQTFSVHYDPSVSEQILNENESLEHEMRTQAKPYKDRILAQDKEIAQALGFDVNSLQGKAISLYAAIDKEAFRKVARKELGKWNNKYDNLQNNLFALDRIIEGELVYQPAKDIDDLKQKKIEAMNSNVGLRYKFELARDEADLYLQLAREAKTGISEAQTKLGLIDNEVAKYTDKDDPASRAYLHDLKQQKRETQRTLGRAQTNFVRLREKVNGLYTHTKDLNGELERKELQRNKYLERATQINVVISYVSERLAQESPEEQIATDLKDFDVLGRNFGKLRKNLQQRNDIRLAGQGNYLAGQQNDMYERVHKEHNAFLTKSLNDIDDLESKIDAL